MARDDFSIDWPHGHVTECGWPARIICTDRKGERPIIALVTYPDSSEGVVSYNADGTTGMWRLINKKPEPVVMNKYRQIVMGSIGPYIPSVTYGTLDEALSDASPLSDTIGVLCFIYHDGVLVDVQHVANMEDTKHLR